MINRFFSIFKSIKDGEWFYIFPEEFFGDIPDYERRKFADLRQVYLGYKNSGIAEEQIEEYMKVFGDALEKNLTPLEKLYHIKCYTSVHNKRYFGEKNKKLRVCRFCGKSFPAVSFTDLAHSIPLAIGNHIFYNNYECDTCNHFCGEVIEPHLINWLGCMLLFSQTSGRNGIPKLLFEKGLMEYDKENNVIVIVQKKNDIFFNDTLDDEAMTPLIQLGEGTGYIPAFVYRALVKIAIGFFPEQYMGKFKNTINWLLDVTKIKKLPKIAYSISQIPCNNPQPEIALYIRKGDEFSNLPFAVASVTMCGLRVVYVIPFVDGDKCDFISDEGYQLYWNTFSIYSNAPVQWTFEDLSKSIEVTSCLNIKFQQRDSNNE